MAQRKADAPAPSRRPTSRRASWRRRIRADLPFAFTGAQERALADVRADLDRRASG